jgi:hypothetical protein
MDEKEKRERSRLFWRSVAIVVVAFAVGGLASVGFMRQRVKEPYVDGPGVTKVGHLSDYLPNLKGETASDAPIWFLDSGKPGATLLIYQSHPCEPVANLEQVLLLERATVNAGRLIVIPDTVLSGKEDLQPGVGFPERFHIKQPDGEVRWFRMGGRMVAQRLQWPLPTIATNYPSGQTLADLEALNLNRNMPGRADGTLTERIAYAVVQLMRVEHVDMVIDNHEAPPDRPLVEAVCAASNSMEIAANTVMNMELDYGIQWRLEASPPSLRGLSHQEIPRVLPNVQVFLMETASPIHGPLRGLATEDLILTGKDPNELRAASMGRVFCKYDENGKPIEQRMGYKMAFLQGLQEAWNDAHPDRPLDIGNVPTYDELVANGIGPYLARVNEPEPWQYLVSSKLF